MEGNLKYTLKCVFDETSFHLTVKSHYALQTILHRNTVAFSDQLSQTSYVALVFNTYMVIVNVLLHWLLNYLSVLKNFNALGKFNFRFIHSLHPIHKAGDCDQLLMEPVHTAPGQLRSALEKGPVHL